MDVVTKSADVEIRPVESEHPNGEFEAVISTEALDRDGDRLFVDEWEQPLPKRIHIDGDHDHSLEKTVGSVVPRIEGNKLVGKGTYASTPYAQMVRQIVNDKDAEGHAVCMSVTFLQKKNQKSGKPQRELMKAAFVTAPANTEAVVLSSKSVSPADLAAAAERKIAELEKKDAPNWRDNQMDAVTDMFENDPSDGGNQPERKEYWQGVHDVAVKLGAGCPYSDPQAVPDVLNGVGNRGVDEAAVIAKVLAHLEQMGFKSSPTESTEESTAPTAEAAEAADESADDMALLEKKLAIQMEANATAFDL